jgi:hypothetical protein
MVFGVSSTDVAPSHREYVTVLKLIHVYRLDFKLSPCSECRMLSSGLLTGDCSLNSNVSGRYLLAYEDGTDGVFRNVGI